MKRKGHRQYDENEMASILERAAKLQGVTSMVPVHGGRTLDEIKAIAAEAGMDAACVEAAVHSFHEVDAPRVPILGRAPRMEFTTLIDGQLDADDRRELLGILQRSLDARGRTRETERSLEWRRFGLLGREMVVVSAHKGKTRLEVRGRYRRGLVGSFVSGGLAGGMASAGLLDLVGLLDLLDQGAVPLILGGAFFAGRTVWGWFSGSKEKKLRALADRMADFTEDSVTTSSPPAPEAVALPPRRDDE